MNQPKTNDFFALRLNTKRIVLAIVFLFSIILGVLVFANGRQIKDLKTQISIQQRTYKNLEIRVEDLEDKNSDLEDRISAIENNQ